MPFAKFNCYVNSTKSPFVFRYPGVIPQGNRVSALISSIDYTPTILDLLGFTPIEGTDGKSLRSVLTCGVQHQYDTIYTMYFKTAKNSVTGRERHFPMRCVQGTEFPYIYNSWADGLEGTFRNESMAGLTFDAMKKAAETDEKIKQRVEFFLYRISEEFYDIKNDPDCLNNLINEEKYHSYIDSYRKKLYQYMMDSQDALVALYKEKVLRPNYIV